MNNRENQRLAIGFLGFIILMLVIVFRSIGLQVLPNERIEAFSNRLYSKTINIEGRRGSLLDKNGNELAVSVPAHSIFLDPKIIKDKKSAAKKLAKVLNLPLVQVQKKLQDSNKRFVWLKRQVSGETLSKVKKLKIRGVGSIEDQARVYPQKGLMQEIIGRVGIGGQGLSGLENRFNSQLAGDKKNLRVKRDAKGRPLSLDGLLVAERPRGSDVWLTIDGSVQYFLEEKLKSTIQEQNAERAWGIVMDAQSSEIIAMSSQIARSQSQNGSAGNSDINILTSEVYEPGSTLKPFIVAGALRQKQLVPNSTYFCENGSMIVSGKKIREADAKHRFGWLSVSEILSFSSNIGTTKIAFQMGKAQVLKTLKDFGFGEKTGVDVPHEEQGIFPQEIKNLHHLSNVSFGHGVAITAMQMAAAYTAIANGGILKKPILIKKIQKNEIEENLNTEFVQTSSHGQRVLTELEAKTMRMLLAGVTADGGTGVRAGVPGFIVAGKTGTAQKVNPKGKGYLSGEYLSSFAGFFPAHKPEFVIYVVVDSPKKSIYGSQVAAPLFSEIANFLVRKNGLAPQLAGVVTLKSHKSAEVLRDPLADLGREKPQQESFGGGDYLNSVEANKRGAEISTSSLLGELKGEAADRPETLRETLRNQNIRL